MADTITLFEHEAIAFDWTDQDARCLDRLNRRLGADILRPTMAGAIRHLQAQQHIGVVRLGAQTIQVLPKIYRSEAIATEQDRSLAAMQNLFHLLSYAIRVPVRESGIASLAQQSSNWLELLTRLFAQHLLKEWLHGAHRQYQIIEETLPVLRGKWRISEQLKYFVSKHVFAVAHDEFMADNSLNRILRFVVERLWRLSRDGRNRRILSEIRHRMEQVTLLPSVTAEAADAIILTYLNARYAPLLNLARFFLRGWAPHLASGRTGTFAFVVDMNQVFEAFIVNFICRHRDVILPDELQTADLLGQSVGAARYLAHVGGQQVFRLRPDLACREGQRFLVLVDAKYKRLNPTEAGAGIAQADFYQMYAYAHRYHSEQVILLYPQTAEVAAPLQRTFDLSDCEATIVAATVDLRGDLGSAEIRKQLINRLKVLFNTGETHD